MADRGYIAVWLDPAKDKDMAWIAVNERFSGYEIQWLNPRHFDSVDSLGVDPRKVRGHVLATADERIYQAYLDAEVEFVDMRDIPQQNRTDPECVVIYTKQDDNEWNAACSAVARSTFPGLVVRPIQLAKYDGPVVGSVVAVVVPDAEQKIADDYGRMHKQVVRVPQPNPSADAATPHSATVDSDVMRATLQLPATNLRAVVQSQTDATWLSELADEEAAGSNRQDVHEVINSKLADMGSSNPHFVAVDLNAPDSAGEPADEEAGEGNGSAGVPDDATLASHDMSYLADMSVRKIGLSLQTISDPETLEAMLASETGGKGRETVVSLIERRIRAIA